MKFSIGDIKKGHQIIRLLKGGAHAETYFTKFLPNNQVRVIKYTNDPILFNYLVNEKEIFKLVSHDPNTTTIYGFYYSEDSPEGFISMESMETDLNEAKDSLNLLQRLEVIRYSLKGLDNLHETYDSKRKRYAHRDIKPSNILLNLTPFFEAKITDFGLATPFPKTTYYEAGTEHYIAPEIKSGLTTDHRCDIFSISVVMKELLQKWEREPLKLLWQIAEKGTQINPQDRFSKCREMVYDLEKTVELPEIKKYLVEKIKPLQISDKDIKFFLKARKQLRKGKIKKGMEEFMENKGWFYPFYIELGINRFKKQQFEEALSLIEKAYHSNFIPQNLKSNLNLLMISLHEQSGTEPKDNPFYDKQEMLFNKKITPKTLEDEIEKALKQIPKQNERSLEKFRIH